jgi:hypothetical protein
MMGGFAIIPDENPQPAALFSDLEQAMDWGVRTYGTDSFSIRWLEVAVLERDEKAAPIGPT